jgi:hypothetical protein
MDSRAVGCLLMICFDRVHPPGVEPWVKPGVWRPKIWAQVWLAQQGHWHRCAHHSGVNAPLKFFQNLHHCTAVSITPLWRAQRCQWLRYAGHSGVNRQLQNRFSRRILIHIQKYFNPCIGGLGGVVWWKNQRLKISCPGPFNKTKKDKWFWGPKAPLDKKCQLWMLNVFQKIGDGKKRRWKKYSFTVVPIITWLF